MLWARKDLVMLQLASDAFADVSGQLWSDELTRGGGSDSSGAAANTAIMLICASVWVIWFAPRAGRAVLYEILKGMELAGEGRDDVMGMTTAHGGVDEEDQHVRLDLLFLSHIRP